MAEEKDLAVHDGQPQAEHNEDLAVVTGAGDESSPEDGSYWLSFRFIGSLIGIMLLANSLFIGYAMPVRSSLSLWASCYLNANHINNYPG